MVDLWLPQGTHINETEAKAKELEAGVRKMEGVTHVSSLDWQRWITLPADLFAGAHELRLRAALGGC